MVTGSERDGFSHYTGCDDVTLPTLETILMRRLTPLVLGLAAVLVTTGCASAPTDPDATAASSAVQASHDAAPIPEVRAISLEAPWSVAFAGETALISERDSGRILEVLGDSTETREVGVIYEVAGRVRTALSHVTNIDGNAAAAAEPTAHALYVYSTGPESNRVHRYELLGEPGEYSLGAATLILDGIPKARNHNGGRIAFGPDGMLYIGTGDAGVSSNSQDLTSLAGKILRLDPDGATPADNPYPDSAVYASGLRNVQGLAWDSDGTLYASEFGASTADELNRILPGGNYGWPQEEGAGEHPDFLDPIQQWPTAAASPSGIAILGTTVYLANLRGERLRAVNLDSEADAQEFFRDGLGRLRDVVVGPDERLWILTNNTDGRGQPAAADDRLLVIDPEELMSS